MRLQSRLFTWLIATLLVAFIEFIQVVVKMKPQCTSMHFEPLAFETGCNLPDYTRNPDAPPNRFYAYGVVGRLAALASSIELERSLPETLESCRVSQQLHFENTYSAEVVKRSNLAFIPDPFSGIKSVERYLHRHDASR